MISFRLAIDLLSGMGLLSASFFGSSGILVV